MATPIQVVFDCADPTRLAQFWATALGYKLQNPPEGYASWPEFLAAQGVPEAEWNAVSAIVDPNGRGPRIYFQRVPEAKTVKNRLHLDLNVGGGQGTPLQERRRRVDSEVERLLAAGASRLAPSRRRASTSSPCATPRTTSSTSNSAKPVAQPQQGSRALMRRHWWRLALGPPRGRRRR